MAEAGTPLARLEWLGQFAVERCGHNPASGISFETAIVNRIADLENLLADRTTERDMAEIEIERLHKDRAQQLERAIVKIIDAIDSRDNKALETALFVARGLTF